MTSASFNAFRKIKVGTTDARYVFDPSTVQSGTAFQLLGLPVIITDNVPDAAADRPQVALVDFSKVVVVRDVDASVVQRFGRRPVEGVGQRQHRQGYSQPNRHCYRRFGPYRR